jgi:hypothetical protein
MGGRIVPDASVAVPLRGLKLEDRGIASDAAISASLRAALTALVRVAGQSSVRPTGFPP